MCHLTTAQVPESREASAGRVYLQMSCFDPGDLPTMGTNSLIKTSKDNYVLLGELKGSMVVVKTYPTLTRIAIQTVKLLGEWIKSHRLSQTPTKTTSGRSDLRQFSLQNHLHEDGESQSKRSTGADGKQMGQARQDLSRMG